ncbi:hypothetical protein HK407_12g16670 [Ordospora pajunii]|uniref:uncharacterized protein n=1 Tax=Ordospora pajunii TaxID=3039483 RepID=UPI0029527398|nr:uncharacterized protein HK407_12g16670 [Ordospora pajunii]KAH9410538.1 hypothetical protein HK407_12g16670 [Ordospora pajunii]
MSDNGSGHTLTVEKFYNTEDDELESILNRRMESNEKKLFLIELSKSEAERTSEPTDKNKADRVQQRIDKIWNVYEVGGVSDLLLDMSDEERKLVLKQLGHKHEIDALIYVGTKKVYNNAKKRKDDVKRIFDAIDDERRKELLNDTIYEDVLSSYKFKNLMKVLKEASVEYKKIADMLLGVRDKDYVALMINYISLCNGDEYLANILLSIDDDDDLKSVISDLRYWTTLAASILSGADDIDKLSRSLNIIKSSGISEEDMKTVLDKLVINKNIVSELIDKPEEEQNAILKVIDNIQLAGKIKYEIEEAQRIKSEQDEQDEQEKERRKLKIAAIVIPVAVIVIEAVITRKSINNALNNGHSMSDEAVISRIAMAAVAMLMMLSMIVYVKCANRPVWYDRLMIGGSVVMALVRVMMCVVMALVRVMMCVFGGMRVIMVVMRVINVVMAVMSLVMAIASVVAFINSKNNNSKNDREDEISDASKNAGGIAKSVIVVLSACVMAITGWVIQIMDMNVSSGMNNEMLQ